ncbi:MAG: sigma-70 family RNA polymerase sigma factor [Planctomycetaceae bacterium]|nr:sigma-70 family RNA polymerase sigma factor [Planctomycetaceae bacterium]
MTGSSSVQLISLKDPDVRLMLQVREDDATAFEELMLRYQGRVLSVLRHVVGNPELAEDLTQDVFLRVFRARKTYTAGSKFSTWLFTIANNVAFNALRRQKRKPECQFVSAGESSVSMPTMENTVPENSAMMPTRQLDHRELRETVRKAVDTLSENQRMAIMLNKFEGMNYADIAQVMKLTPQAVKSLLCRARSNLRIVLEPYMERGKKIEKVTR